MKQKLYALDAFFIEKLKVVREWPRSKRVEHIQGPHWTTAQMYGGVIFTSWHNSQTKNIVE